MSQVGNALNMLILLKSRGKMKAKELADILEVKERTIRRYKEDLMQAGIYIMSEGGKDGGYYIDTDDYLLGLNITDDEYISLLIAEKQFSDTNHPVTKDFQMFLEKINVIYEKSASTSSLTDSYMVKDAKSNIDVNKERKKLLDIKAAIIARNKILLEYVSLSSGLSKRIIRPYAVYRYKGDMYFAAFCQKREKVIDFKLSRIRSYEILDERFEKDKNFSLESFMKSCIGIYKGKEYSVKLKISFPMSQIIKEKIWVEEQEIVDCENNAIIFKAKMRGLEEIKSWILSMKSQVEVIEPEELRTIVIEEINKIKNIYKKSNS